MALAYRYAAGHLRHAQGRWNEQKSNMGMLEINLDRLGIPNGQEILSLSFSEATIPGRKITRGQIEYLNGTVFYPQRPEPLGELSAVYRDYIDSNTRLFIERWFDRVYDEQTGLMTVTNRLKTTGRLVLFGSDGVTGVRRYRLTGVFPMGEPDIRVDHKTGEQILMEMSLSVDFIQGIQK